MLLLPGFIPIITEKNEMRQVAVFPESGVWITGQNMLGEKKSLRNNSGPYQFGLRNQLRIPE